MTSRKAPPIRLDGSHLVECRPEEYEKLLGDKIKILDELMSPLLNATRLNASAIEIDDYSSSSSNNSSSKITAEVFDSQKSHFRMRANFTVIKDGAESEGGLYFAMYPESDRRPHEVKSFPRGTVLLNSLMERLFDEIKSTKVLNYRLFEVRFLTTKLGEAVIVLIYHIALVDEEWKAAANILAKSMNATIIGRCRGKMIVSDGENGEVVKECLNINGRGYTYFQTEGAFSQPNADVCEKMIGWALDATRGSQDHDLLELYCGGGTFTAPLAQNFRKVLATEVSKPSVQLASKCFAANGVTNIKVARLSSEEFTDAYVNDKAYHRLQEIGVKMSDYDLKTVFVDPPRAGLDDGTCTLVSRFEKIVYVSCNPITLARDLAKLARTHTIVKYAGFDQFPYTHHLEAGVILVKRPDRSPQEPLEKEDASSLGKRKLEE